MAGGAGGGGQAIGRLVAHPGQGAEVGADPSRQTGADLSPAGAAWVQAVVDGEHQQAAAMGAGPGVRHQGQGDGIPTPGQGDGQARARETGEPAVEDRAQALGQAAHFACDRAAAARLITAGGALG